MANQPGFEIDYRPRHSPKTFQLATNYRSHAGIVNCAQSVIELITTFWPYSIDTLAREKGIVDGLKPVFLSGWDADNVRYVRPSFNRGVHKLIYSLYSGTISVWRQVTLKKTIYCGVWTKNKLSTISGSHIEFGAQQC